MSTDNGMTVIFAGTSLYLDELYYEYIKRVLSEYRFKIGREIYLQHNSAELPLLIQEIQGSHEPTRLLILCEKKAFPVVSKIVATLGGDTLAVYENSIYPATASIAENGNYLYRVNDTEINVIRADKKKALPPILIKDGLKKIYDLFINAEEQKGFEKTLEDLETLPCFIGWAKFASRWYKVELDNEKAAWECREKLKRYLYRSISDNMVLEKLIEYLSSMEKSITFAESCTGGLLAAAFVSKAGTSEILKGSYITYSNESKEKWLGVKKSTLLKYGAVSRECVLEMAEGIQRISGSDIAVAISGIAGPGGAVPGKDVGTVFVCVRNRHESVVEKLDLKGDRNMIQHSAVKYAVEMIINSEEESFFEFFNYDT